MWCANDCRVPQCATVTVSTCQCHDSRQPCAEQEGEAAVLATRTSCTSSCPTTERLGSSELQGNYRAYPPLRSQSASHFNVSEVAEMWARDDEVFIGGMLRMKLVIGMLAACLP